MVLTISLTYASVHREKQKQRQRARIPWISPGIVTIDKSNPNSIGKDRMTIFGKVIFLQKLYQTKNIKGTKKE